MLRNFFLINMVLVITLGFLGSKLYKVVTYSMEIPSEAAVNEGSNSKDTDIKLKDRVPDKASFQIISSKDLFKPSRTASTVTAVRPTPTEAKDLPKLFATIVRGSASIAILEDSGTKKTKGYRIDDLVAGYKISEILEDRIILTSGDDKVEIKLRDDKGIKSSRPTPRITQNNTPKRTVPRRRTVPARRRPPNEEAGGLFQ